MEIRILQALLFDGQAVRFDPRHAEPTPAPDEVVIRPVRMGVCSMDLDTGQGLTPFRGVLGHEFVGHVESVGHKQHRQWLGKRVTGTINCVCSKCDMCLRGLREHCRQRTVLGLVGRDGRFADYFTLPVINLAAVPDSVDDDQAVFASPLAAAYQILRQLTIEGRPYITVLGDGRLGLLCAQVMSQLNATVRLVGKHPDKLALCEKWGVKHRLLADVGLRGDQDIVVDCTGSPTGLETAMRMVRPRGTIVMKTTLAPHAAMAKLDLSPLVVHEIQLVGSRCGPLPEALNALATGKVDVVSLISRRAKLADGVEAMQRAQADSHLIKVLLEP